MTARVSRRGLLGLGLSRLTEDRAGALDGAATDRRARAAEALARRREDAARAWSEGEGRAWFAALEPAARHLLEVCDAGPGVRLLDVAAGDGNTRLPRARAAAFDERGAEVARGDGGPQAGGRQRDAAIEWAVADAEALPYPDASFDRVVSNFGVIHADDPRAAAAELARVVRPGGTVAVTAWDPSGLMGGVLQLAARSGRSSARTRPERWGRYETATLYFSHYDSFEFLDATLTMELDSGDAAWRHFSEPPGPLAGPLRAGADRPALRSAFDALIARHAVERPDALVLEAAYTVIVGRR